MHFKEWFEWFMSSTFRLCGGGSFHSVAISIVTETKESVIYVAFYASHFTYIRTLSERKGISSYLLKFSSKNDFFLKMFKT